ncbi:TPA: hypothetical protein P6X17_001205 [Staphylococcus aureus]|nr:hypothetical protein [Staphylococcus aureus]MBH4672980.1 hypothetical protein [Staphylococcus aureus]HDP5847779.1 hypothetical protein [Staphylococcus aureus]HDP6027422.1 hypothetical protein [Staphylococcus aureus]HDP6108953.1 hypothetical protein [Staphylococcus aureus]
MYQKLKNHLRTTTLKPMQIQLEILQCFDLHNKEIKTVNINMGYPL